jgi:hypothetical protein
VGRFAHISGILTGIIVQDYFSGSDAAQFQKGNKFETLEFNELVLCVVYLPYNSKFYYLV